VSASKNSSKRGLGRGFEALIPVELLDESFDPTATQDQQVSELRQIKIDQIIPDPNQPRHFFDDGGLEDLADSIREHGVLQPIIVTPHKGGYQIVAGERRFRASKIAGVTKMPALVRTLTDQHRLEISLIENLQRKDLNVMETATAYLKLRDQFNLTLEQIAKRVGVGSISTVSNKLRLLKLPDFVRKALADGSIMEGQARPIIGLDEALIKTILPKIIKEGWSSHRIEQFVVDYKKNKADHKVPASKKITEQPYREQLSRIQNRLDTEVKIQSNTKGAGNIIIRFKSEEELNRLQDLLGN
jgi:ParB family chromosome partitioning protein